SRTTSQLCSRKPENGRWRRFQFPTARLLRPFNRMPKCALRLFSQRRWPAAYMSRDSEQGAVRDRSLQDLEGLDWGEANFDSSVVICRILRGISAANPGEHHGRAIAIRASHWKGN